MLLPVFGSAGAAGAFALEALSALAHASAGPHELIHANTGSDFSTAWSARKSDDVIAFSDSPDAELVGLFRDAGIPFSVFLEPNHSIMESVWELARTDLWPFRTRLASLAALHDLVLAPSAMLVRSDARSGRDALLATLASHYRLTLTNDQIATARAKLALSDGSQPELLRVRPLSLPEGALLPDPVWRDRLARTLAGFAPLIEQQRVESLSWPREMFLTAKEDGSPGPLTKPVELTGSARTVIWGPYLTLPRGRWSARVTVACDRNPSGCRMGGDIYAEVVQAFWEFRLPEEGVYTFDVVFQVTEPRNAIELRFFLREGMIDGVFDLRAVEFTRLP